MKKIILALTIALHPGLAALAQQIEPQPKKPLTLSRPNKSNACAAYGPGFVKVAGSDMCIKVGGSVGVDAGGRR